MIGRPPPTDDTPPDQGATRTTSSTTPDTLNGATSAVPPGATGFTSSASVVAPRPAPLDLPEVLDVGDVAAVFHLTRSGARRGILRGDFGAYSAIGRRLYLLRADVLESLRSRQVRPDPRPSAPPVPDAAPWAKILLRRGRRSPPAGT